LAPQRNTMPSWREKYCNYAKKQYELRNPKGHIDAGSAKIHI